MFDERMIFTVSSIHVRFTIVIKVLSTFNKRFSIFFMFSHGFENRNTRQMKISRRIYFRIYVYHVKSILLWVDLTQWLPTFFSMPQYGNHFSECNKNGII